MQFAFFHPKEIQKNFWKTIDFVEAEAEASVFIESILFVIISMRRLLIKSHPRWHLDFSI